MNHPTGPSKGRAQGSAGASDPASLEELIDHLPVPVAFLDRDFTFIRVNPAYARAAGQPPEDYPGRNHFQLFPDEEHQRIFQGVVDSGEPFETIDQPFDLRQKPHEPEPLTHWDWSLRPVTGEDGEVRRLVLTLVDVSEHKQARDTLALLVEELERKNQELQEFAYLASHDLQEPLRKVRMFGDRLADKYAAALDRTGLDYLRRMNRACGRMSKFIEDLLAYSRVTTQARPFQEVDLFHAAELSRSNLEARIEQTGGRVTVQPLPVIEADPGQMIQLLQNLMGNGLKFHRQGVPPEVTVHGRVFESEEGSWCEIVVEDNGIGFAEEHLEQIFMPFRRLHGRTAYEGTGIGLALCRKIVERHGGTLRAESEPGEGSRFFVTLPVKPQESISESMEGGEP